jgi:putative peptide zinc metalloprotease protein
MAAPRKTFSDHWHMVSGQRVWLLPTVRIQRQEFEGGRWHVVENPMSGQFFRLHPAAYAFVSRLAPDRTVEEAWDSVVRAHPETAPTQEEVVRLLGQLQSAGLLRGELPADSRRLLDRYQKSQAKKVRSQLASVSSFKLPLFNPDTLLCHLAPLGRLAFSWPGLVIWVAVIGIGLKLAADHWQELAARSAGALDPANVPMLAVVFTIIKVIHELGHGLACRRFCGEVRETGVMFMFLAPFPYIDTTSSWGFRERSKRILVSAAGMIFELFVASIALMVWVRAGDPGVKALAYQVVFVASVTTVLFNANPLLRYDAYYMLSDWLRVPNLQQRSNQMLRHLCERHLFGMSAAVTPALTVKEAWILAVYGVVANVYRIVLFSTLIAWIAGEYLILGLLMAVGAAYGMFVRPMAALVRYLGNDARLGRHRTRAVIVTCGGIGLVLGLLWFVPAPHAFRAPGIIDSSIPMEIHTKTAGVLIRVMAEPGSHVSAGDVLLKFENQELAWKTRELLASREEVLAEWRRAEAEGDEELAPYAAALAAVDRDLEILDSKKAGLTVKAPLSGRWEAPGILHHQGRWMSQGEKIGRIIGSGGRVFRAVVSEGDASHFFSKSGAFAQVRLRGDAVRVLAVDRWHLVPAYRDELPSAALGWEAGGEIEAKTDEKGSARARQPFFEVRADLSDSSEPNSTHGRSGEIRFRVRDEPYLRQWVTDLRRFMQKRYRL